MTFRVQLSLIICLGLSTICKADPIRDLQNAAIENGKAEFGHWGWEVDRYVLWGTHSNRLIPVYTFGTLGAGEGIDLQDYTSENSVYRAASNIRKLYGYLPAENVNPSAEYMDQTNIADIQFSALLAKKKHVILVVFDGMDWQTTQAASIAKLNKVAYQEGRGTGLFFQDYAANGTSQFSYMVTSPHSDGGKDDVNAQTVTYDFGKRGGYVPSAGGETPWAIPAEPKYLVGQSSVSSLKQTYTDSASSATSMTAGIKTYNAAINVNPYGFQVPTIAHIAQRTGYKIGVVTSVPISHATPAAAYAHNVARHDYQDLSRDMLGLPSISHPGVPLPGVDLLLGAGFGETRTKDNSQGENFIPGNVYLSEADLLKLDVRNGGKYVVAQRESGVIGAEQLKVKASEASENNQRLFGFFGVKEGHLPFQTTDGKYDPPQGRKKSAEVYSESDVIENPTLAEMTGTALAFLSARDDSFWLMVEAGDVDWANHDNNLDNSIGAVFSGDAAVKTICDWVEEKSSWDETVLIVTADHGHFLVLEKPELLVSPSE